MKTTMDMDTCTKHGPSDELLISIASCLDYGWEDNEKTAELPGDMGITEKLTSSILRISHVDRKSVV